MLVLDNDIKNCGIRVIELFSGIGGMRLSLIAASLKLSSIVAYDTSIVANACYSFNFSTTENGSDRLRRVNIEGINPNELDGQADLWTMSPPCQPFTKTRHSLRLDQDDKRCKAFQFLMKALISFEIPPKWILLENVKGFVGSQMHTEWCDTLRTVGYSWKEYVISPKHFGIPNNRMRCYMLCELSNRFSLQNLMSPPPVQLSMENMSCSLPVLDNANNILLSGKNDNSTCISSVDDFDEVMGMKLDPEEELLELEQDEDHDKQQHVSSDEDIAILRYRIFLSRETIKMKELHNFLLPDLDQEYLKSFTLTYEELQKPWAHNLSIVSPYDIETYCFTSGYSRIHHRASGSYLLMNGKSPLAIDKLDRSDMTKYDQQIRKFAPEELLLLFGFPSSYRFPDDINLSQRFRLIGNSISIYVVEIMVRELFDPYKHDLLATSNEFLR